MTVKQFLEQIRDDSIEDGNLWTAELAKAGIADYDAQSLELQELKASCHAQVWFHLTTENHRLTQELQAVREALGKLLDSACSVPAPYIGNANDPVNDLRIVSGRRLDALRAALKPSRGAT